VRTRKLREKQEFIRKRTVKINTADMYWFLDFDSGRLSYIGVFTLCNMLCADVSEELPVSYNNWFEWRQLFL
jgi:hypothetical protein